MGEVATVLIVFPMYMHECLRARWFVGRVSLNAVYPAVILGFRVYGVGPCLTTSSFACASGSLRISNELWEYLVAP